MMFSTSFRAPASTSQLRYSSLTSVPIVISISHSFSS
jgi:hypothetical protein